MATSTFDTINFPLLQLNRMPLLHSTIKSFRTFQSLPKLIRVFSPSPTIRTMASMAQRLSGKTVLITGASSGIGRSTAFEFAKTSPKDLKLILTARRIDTLKEIAEEIKKEVGEGVKVLPVKLDVSDTQEIKKFVEGLEPEWKNIDVLVNNAWVLPVFELLDRD